jgi:hypothetical protein
MGPTGMMVLGEKPAHFATGFFQLAVPGLGMIKAITANGRW